MFKCNNLIKWCLVQKFFCRKFRFQYVPPQYIGRPDITMFVTKNKSRLLRNGWYFLGNIFDWIFIEKYMNLIIFWLKVYSWVCDKQSIITASGNGFVTNRWQDITWTDDDMVRRLTSDICITRARFLSLTRSKLRLCSANHRAGYVSNLACDWLSIVWANSEQETENGPRTHRVNTLRSRQNGQHFADDIFKRIFVNENVWISIKISLKFAPKGPINNIPALVQIMAWRHPDNKPLSEPMMVRLHMHICVNGSQWVNSWSDITLIKIQYPTFPVDSWQSVDLIQWH